MSGNKWHPTYREPAPVERDTAEANYRRLVQMERSPGDAMRMVTEALRTAATMLGDTALAGHLWGLHDHRQFTDSVKMK